MGPGGGGGGTATSESTAARGKKYALVLPRSTPAERNDFKSKPPTLTAFSLILAKIQCGVWLRGNVPVRVLFGVFYCHLNSLYSTPLCQFLGVAYVY